MFLIYLAKDLHVFFKLNIIPARLNGFISSLIYICTWRHVTHLSHFFRLASKGPTVSTSFRYLLTFLTILSIYCRWSFYVCITRSNVFHHIKVAPVSDPYLISKYFSSSRRFCLVLAKLTCVHPLLILKYVFWEHLLYTIIDRLRSKKGRCDSGLVTTDY